MLSSSSTTSTLASDTTLIVSYEGGRWCGMGWESWPRRKPLRLRCHSQSLGSDCEVSFVSDAGRGRLAPPALRSCSFCMESCAEQANWYRPQWGPTPGYRAQSAQLTEARAASEWLALGSFTVQQQALRDFAQAMKNFWAGTHGRPSWRSKGIHEGFRIVGVRPTHVRRLNRRWGEVSIPKV